ncbi:MAG: hypothetical protein VB064_02625 [Oscillospiraceae bacterium]|nr:hypothetical protein [Oscillospiraceae bacterium]
MGKNKSNRQKLKEHTPEKVEQANTKTDENQNQEHNVKKVPLGINTRHL